MSDKQLILNIVEKIDETTSYEDILYALHMQYEVTRGIKDMEEGNVKSSEEVKEIIKNGSLVRSSYISYIRVYR